MSKQPKKQNQQKGDRKNRCLRRNPRINREALKTTYARSGADVTEEGASHEQTTQEAESTKGRP